MSMIHGVEIRVPFLDEETVRLAYKTTPQIKFSGSRPKQFLIDMFKNDMPTEIWDRPKMGFSFPFSKWLSNSSFVKDKTNIDNKNLSSYYNKFINGNLHWSQLMSLIILNQRGLN
jgi:asparagine synthase (glutamine-hydrolysing)